MYSIDGYGVQHFYVDTYTDIANIKIDSLAMGSTIFVIDTSTHYMLNGNKQWVTVTLGSGGGGGAIPSSVIYEGGGV